MPATFYSTQGNYGEIDEEIIDDNFSQSEISTFFDMISSERSSTLSIKPKIRSKIKKNNKHLKGVSTDKEIIEHIKKCKQCKKTIFKTIKKKSINRVIQ